MNTTVVSGFECSEAERSSQNLPPRYAADTTALRKMRYLLSAKFPRHVLILVLFLSTGVSAMQPTDTRTWSDRVIPLPKRISVKQSIRLRTSQVALKLDCVASPQVETAARLLQPFASCTDQKSGFTITLGLAPITVPSGHPCPETFPIADQAYRITPLRHGLALTANTPLGLLYAARTL